MDALPLDSVSPSTHATHASYVRKDTVMNDSTLTLENNAPDWDAPFNGFKVPKIV